MTKLLLVGFNLVILFAYKLFFGGDVTVTQDFPTEVNSGETFMVEVEINKGDREGFAKWQQRLPKGFVAKSGSTKGATFSFKNQEVKLIWMSLPKEESFKIKYEVSTSQELDGDYRLAGKFSYIEENERKDIGVDEQIITVKNGTTEVASKEDGAVDDVNTSTNDDTLSDVANTENFEEEMEEVILDDEQVESIETIDSPVVKGMVTDNDDLKIEREITPLDKGNYEVTLTINKGAFNSFGKIEEHLPPNYEASAISSKQGIFSFENKVMKILWMTLPKDETIKIKYALKSNEQELEDAIIHGVFSYLDGDESKQIKMKATAFTNYAATEEIIADNNINDENEDKNNMVSDLSNENNDAAFVPEMESVEEITNISSPEDSDEKEASLVEAITNIPLPEIGISYKVQIAASHKEVKQIYFKQRHGIEELVSIEFHNSWFKYTLGGYPLYKEARDKRNSVWAEENKINDAFVTAYNSGERISVQEALMISKQKWYK